MVETTTFAKTRIFCNHCEEELEFYMDDKEGLPRCAGCNNHFNAGEEIECEPCWEDCESRHWHKKCYANHEKELNDIVEYNLKIESKETAVKPIPPLSKDRGILGVIL